MPFNATRSALLMRVILGALTSRISKPLVGQQVQGAQLVSRHLAREGLVIGSEGLAALQIRRVEERLLTLFSAGKLNGTVHTCIGQEWVGVAVAASLRKDDYVFSNYRGHGHSLARTGNVAALIAEVMGKTTGACKGIGDNRVRRDVVANLAAT